MSLAPPYRAVLIDMAYEIGGVGLAGFPKFLAAIRVAQWATAAVELKTSLLFRQVPVREQSNIAILTSGTFPNGVTCAEDLIKHHEGCIFTAKPDAKGKFEIGYGHDIPPPAPGDPYPTCVQEQADSWFEQDFALATSRAISDLGADYW